MAPPPLPPLFQSALDHWNLIRRGRAMPSRRDLDPAAIPAVLPFIVLTDVLSADPLEMRYRLIGTAIRRRIARDYTGLSFRDVPHQGPGSMIWELRARCVASCAPVPPADPPYVGPDEDVDRVHEMQLPLSSDGRTVDGIFTVVAFDRRPF